MKTPPGTPSRKRPRISFGNASQDALPGTPEYHKAKKRRLFLEACDQVRLVNPHKRLNARRLAAQVNLSVTQTKRYLKGISKTTEFYCYQ